MGTILENFIEGIIGPLVFRKVNGKQLVSSRREKGSGKQTANSVRTSNTFGMASALAAKIRKKFFASSKDFCDSEMVNRINQQMVGILNNCRDPETMRYTFEQESFDPLNGINFNIKSPLAKSLGAAPVYGFEEGVLTISAGREHMPLMLKYPKDGTLCDLTVAVAVFDLKENKMADNQIQRITIYKKDPAAAHHFKFEVAGGCLCVAGMLLRFYGSRAGRDLSLTTKTFAPGGICAAIYTPSDDREEVARPQTPMYISPFLME